MALTINPLGGELKTRDLPPVTLPAISLPEIDTEREAREAATAIAERKIIRLGVDAWRLTQKSASFENWKFIGAALQIGRDVAVRATGVTTGRHYTRAFTTWASRHGFNGMNKEARWAAVDLVENLPAITQWRETLPEKERRRLINPLSNCRRWRRSLTPKVETDAVTKAEIAWTRFVALMQTLPPEQAAPMWREMQRQSSAALSVS